MKIGLKFSFLIIILVSIFQGWYYLTQGFRLAKVAPIYSLFSTWEPKGAFYAPSFQEEIFYLDPSWSKQSLEELFAQPFFFLGKGQQCYAFISEDKNYVLKLIRLDKLRFKPWEYFWEKSFRLRREKPWNRMQTSLSLVKQKLAPSYGVISIHLGFSEDMKKKVLLFDSLHRKKELCLDHCYFIIQKKVEVLQDILSASIPPNLSEISYQLIQATYHRAKKQIRNKNRHCLKNLGFYKGKVIEIDLAEFSYRPQMQGKLLYEEVYKSLYEYQNYLKQVDSAAYEAFQVQLQKLKSQVEHEKDL